MYIQYPSPSPVTKKYSSTRVSPTHNSILFCDSKSQHHHLSSSPTNTHPTLCHAKKVPIPISNSGKASKRKKKTNNTYKHPKTKKTLISHNPLPPSFFPPSHLNILKRIPIRR